MITIQDIEAASERLDGVAVRTPLLQNAELDAIAKGPVLIKPECFQPIGSFKIRGAYNRLSQLDDARAKRGVVAFSSGNHAQGVALAGQILGIHAAIVMPEDAPAAKLENTRRLGGEVITYDRYSGDREAIARDIATERGAALVPSYDHAHIIAGQGTIGLELATQSAAMNMMLDQVLIPCGGGGMTSGCAVALKSHLPDVQVFAVEPEGYDDTARSLISDDVATADTSQASICDALLAESPGELPLEIMRTHGVQGVVVSEDDVRAAMRFAFQKLKLVVEPGGAVALAALLSDKVETAGRATAIVVSGGNVDLNLFAEVQTELG